MNKAVVAQNSIVNQYQNQYQPNQYQPALQEEQVPTIKGLEVLEKVSEYIINSGLFGIKNKAQAITLMLLSQSEGIHPVRAVMEYYIIQGKPSLRADAMLARFQKAGGRVIWHELTDQRAKATFEHPQGGKVTIEWDIERARKANLVKPGSSWEKYPRAMLRARVISEGVRTVFPGVTTGLYTPEELQDDFTEAPTVIETETETEETIEEEKPKWDLAKIREIAVEELKMLVKKYRIPTTEVIALFEKFNGDQKAIITI